MKYEILVIKTERPESPAVEGQYVVAMPDKHNWTEKERSTRFEIISFDGSQDDINTLAQFQFKYDFKKKGFFLDGIAFDASKSIKVSKVPVYDMNNAVTVNTSSIISEKETVLKISPTATSADGSPLTNENAIKFLEPYIDSEESLLGFKNTRDLFSKKFFKFLELPEHSEMSSCWLYGSWSQIALMGFNLSATSKSIISNSGLFTIEELSYLRRIWLLP